MIGRTVSNYRILEEIGHGGMGRVFKAQDLKLGRLVALKFIKSTYVDQPDTRQRFIQEARAASSLDHPNICTIHQVDEDPSGGLYIVMSYYDGEVLDHKIQRTGAMAVEDVIEIGAQICQGLFHAHQAGVVHRDIKPANIMLTREGMVKILDFGLAKSPENSALTEPGRVIGTLQYLSPEQVSGAAVDHRSDVWSTAVVLYECLNRESPFQRKTAAATLNAILNEEVPLLQVMREDVSPELSELLDCALSKTSELRPPSIDDFLNRLQPVAAGRLSSAMNREVIAGDTSSSGPIKPSVLVLPFRNTGSESGNDYFTDGLTDELITDLSTLRKLRVIATTSSMLLKGGERSIREVARDVRVRYVLEGSVQWLGDKMRITAQLIDAATESVVWADKYRGTLDDVFHIQEDISGKIADALKVELTSEERAGLGTRPMSDIQAYEFYLKAKAEVLSYSQPGLTRAMDYLNKAAERVSENIYLLSAMGQVNWQLVNAGVSQSSDYLQKSNDCAAAILKQEPESPHGLRLLGLVSIQEGNFAVGVGYLNKALVQDPSDADTLGYLVSCHGLAGLTARAWPMARHLVSIDPLTPLYQALPGFLHMMDGKFADAIPILEAATKMDVDNPAMEFLLGQALAMEGETARSLTVLDNLAHRCPGSFFGTYGVMLGCALRQDRDGALAALTPELEQSSRGPQFAWQLVQVLALVGERQQALDRLQIAVENGLGHHRLISEVDPLLVSLRSEARLQELVTAARVEQQKLEP